MNKTQRKLIAATARLLQRDGLARVPTREIAREAGVTEGVIYHHFKDKAELLLAVVRESVGEFREVLANLPLQVGLQSVRENLERLALAHLEAQQRIAPIVCSLFADQQLLERTREILGERKIGQHGFLETVTFYLQAEQRLGRVSTAVGAPAAAEILLAMGFHGAMLDRLLVRDPDPEAARQRVAASVQVLLAGLTPLSAAEIPATGMEP